MTTYTVDSNGGTSPTSPAFPQATINDVLTPDGSFDQTGTVVIADGAALTLQSLFIGSAIEVDLGFLTSPTLTGTGSITGSNDTSKLLPAFVSAGGTLVDINGTIAVAFTSNGQLTVSAGERLDIEGNLSAGGGGATTVAAGGELDLNSQSTALVGNLSSRGTLKVTAPNTALSGATTLGGTVVVQGDAANGVGSGVLVSRGAYVATLDLRQATLSAPIGNLTLLQDAQIRFGTGMTTVQRLVIAGSANALTPLDAVNLDGTLTVTGDKSGTANGIVVSQAEFAGVSTGGGTIAFAVAATDGGASLQQQLAVDARTTLRNDGKMTIGGVGTATTVIGAVGAGAGSAFINGAAGQLSIGTGAALSVAAIQNLGAITVTGSATFVQPLANTGSIDVAAGTLALAGTVQGAGTIAVESGATLRIDGAGSQGTVDLRAGSVLRLSQAASFAGTIRAPALGAAIDLVGVNATRVAVANGAITVTTATGTFNLAETGLINGTTLALSADGAGGSLITVAQGPVAYRFFDKVHGTQFLTTSLTETQSLQANRPDLVFEGVGLAAVDPNTDPAAAPVFRFFDSKFGTHFYTTSTAERDDVVAKRPDLISEGTGFYEHTTQQAGDAPVYRFFDSNFGTHFYTASATERANIVASRPDLVSEGIGFYAPST